MYRCLECGHIFEDGEEKRWTEPHGENLSGCPICCGAYEEAGECKICGSNACDNDDNFCEDCKKDISKRFNNFLNTLTEEEQELLFELVSNDRF